MLISHTSKTKQKSATAFYYTTHDRSFESKTNIHTMSSDGLNSGARSWAPGGAPAAPPDSYDESFSEYAEMMDNIEAEQEGADDNDLAEHMAGAAVGSPAVATSELPAHLAHHAAEFWFPECRNCQCCNGYKHGCTCSPSHGGVCRCSGGSLQPSAPGPTHSGGPGRGAGRGGSGRGGRGGRGGKASCKFFMSPAGCRFADSCRFAHT